MIKNLAKETGKSKEKVEGNWKKAKKAVGVTKGTKDDSKWAQVNAITQRMSGKKKTNESFISQLDSIFECDENLKGGKADGMTPEDIAKKHGVSVEEINKQLEMGMEIEKEHAKDEKTRMEIALDHIAEIKNYYTRLSKMEKEAKKE